MSFLSSEISQTWVTHSSYVDGTGPEYQSINFKQGDILYEVCFMLEKQKLWFYRRDREDSDSIRMKCTSLKAANKIVEMLKDGDIA